MHDGADFFFESFPFFVEFFDEFNVAVFLVVNIEKQRLSFEDHHAFVDVGQEFFFFFVKEAAFIGIEW